MSYWATARIPIPPGCWLRCVASCTTAAGHRSSPTCSAPSGILKAIPIRSPGWSRRAAWSPRPLPGPPSPQPRSPPATRRSRQPPYDVPRSGRPADLLDEAPRWSGAHAGSRGCAGSGWGAGARLRARRPRRLVLPGHVVAVHPLPGPGRHRFAGGEGLRLGRRAGGGSGRGGRPVRPVAQPGLHLGPCRDPGARRGRRPTGDPDHLLVVSEEWRRILREEYQVGAEVVRNGVDPSRFPPVSAARVAELRASVGAQDRFVLLAVGGIEPRKGSKALFRALGLLRGQGLDPVLVILGGHSFRDYAAYREEALALLPGLGLAVGTDVVELGTVTDAVLADWYRSADALAFPSTVEGFGLVALEALAAELPVVASDLPVFRQFLTDGQDALLPPVDDPVALSVALQRVMTDPRLRATLVAGGRAVVPAFTWAASATRHAQIYQAVRRV